VLNPAKHAKDILAREGMINLPMGGNSKSFARGTYLNLKIHIDALHVYTNQVDDVFHSSSM
jgi:hypothetical protein